MKKSILFLTDLSNGESEDIITIEYLKKDFEVTTSYFDNIQEIEDTFDLIIVRNTWPSHHGKAQRYHKLKNDFFKRAKIKNIRVYNDMHANCDRQGKDYLVKLYQDSFPVIPSIDSISDLCRLPQINQYIIKPKDGFSSIGVKTVQGKDVLKMSLENFILQPKINFRYEISFYFIDKEFLYCLIFEPSKIPYWPQPKYYEPTSEELQFAQKFINWNTMEFGVCRIDALRTHEGELLMLEIEDDSPYFSITEIDERLKNLFLEKILKSVKSIISI